MKYILIITAIIAMSTDPALPHHIVSEKTIHAYPFHALKQRALHIKNNYTKIRLGISPHQVAEILGEPDEIRYCYEPKKYKPKLIGYTYWYVIQRKTDKGPQNGRDEKLVRVSFDLNWTVVRIDHWGF